MAAPLTSRIDAAGRKAGEVGHYLAQTVRLMVGLPDYGSYLAHMDATHPGAQVMSYEEFFRERQAARYGAGGRMSRCC